MRTIAIANQKGGAAKTTTAVNLAAALAEQQQRVLVIDLDPQGSASAWFKRASTDKGLLEVFTDNVHLADLVADTDVPGVALVPASPWLSSIEKHLAGEVGSEMLLRRALGRLRGDYTVVLVDCPPALGFLAVSALVACREVLVPVEASAMALAGLVALVQTVDRVRDRLNPELALSGILACRVDARTNLARDVVDRLREKFGTVVFETVIREGVRHREAPSFHQPITTYDPQGPGAADYRAAARELLRRAKRA